MSSSGPSIRVVELAKSYRVGARKLPKDAMLVSRLAGGIGNAFRKKPATEANLHWALRDISLEVASGEILGLIGNNGAGKSTLLKILARITDPTSGYAELRGRVGSLLEVGTGFHPELTGRENVYLSGAILGMRRAEISRDFDEIVAFAEVEKFIDTPIKHYSSGMHVRLAFAVATQLRPEILLIDEVLAVGDARFQRKCLQRIQDVSTGARTIIFVSHNMAAVRAICKTGLVLDGGKIVARGEIGPVVDEYLVRAQPVETTELEIETESFKLDRVAISGPENGVIKTFETLELKVTFTSKVDIDRPGLLARLMTSNHEQIAGLDFANFGSIGAIASGEQRDVAFCVDNLPLLPGMYYVELELKNRKSREVVSRLFPFEVAVTPVFGTPKGQLGTKHGAIALKARVVGGRDE
jgi:lipopolysaccharide transport system ATP-binding protein